MKIRLFANGNNSIQLLQKHVSAQITVRSIKEPENMVKKTTNSKPWMTKSINELQKTSKREKGRKETASQNPLLD